MGKTFFSSVPSLGGILHFIIHKGAFYPLLIFKRKRQRKEERKKYKKPLGEGIKIECEKTIRNREALEKL